MHSSESPPVQPASGPNLLLQLGKLIIRARSTSPEQTPEPTSTPRLSKLLPSTSQEVLIQPQLKSDEDEEAVLEEELSNHVNALWTDMEPVCIEVLLSPECRECGAAPPYERARHRPLLLERWTMRAIAYKSHETPAFINSQWLLNAVRSQLHFSQLSAWLARLHSIPEPRRKLSREQCNYKKMEDNCDEEDIDQRKLDIVYSIKTPGENKMAEFAKPPIDHIFPVTDIGNSTYLKIILESLPRLDDIPTMKCTCQKVKRRTSKDTPNNIHEELVGKLNDLSIGSRKFDGAINSNIGTPNRRLSIISNPGSTEYLFTAVDKDKEVVDDRMLTPCNENGKHKCNCDDESDSKDNKDKIQPPKKLDERRLKEIAKYKRRIRKEKMKQCDSTSSEGELKSKETTSIPILQASRFDRFRAIGCYRNQTYLTLPASRIETKSPFTDADSTPPLEFKKTNTVGTQTDVIICDCGNIVDMKCENCHRGMVRSVANYNLASLTDDKHEIGARRKLGDINDEKSLKKHKCDNSVRCDNVNSNFNDGLIKRPKLRRVFPIVERIEKIVNDRQKKDTEKDIQDLHLKTDDSVFSVPKDSKRQKTFSIGDDDYVLYEKCDYGTIDHHDIDSPKDEYSPDFKFAAPDQDGFQKDSFETKNGVESLKDGFVFPDPKKGHDNVPSPSEMDKFRWRFSSAACMVFHSRTGLPLTSSPAPLRRGNSCFGFDDSITGIQGIKSALFHPISPVSPAPPASPVSPPARRTPPPKKERNKLKMGPSTGLLGSFEESALQGRLEAVATVHGFTAELGASGAFCPPHKRLPVTVFFYAPGGTNAPYMGHINLGPGGYRVAPSGTVQVSLFNPHGTLVKMFVVLYSLAAMPPGARTFLRQRTLYMPAGAAPPADHHKWLRYLIHLRFMTSKSGKLYLHTDIRLIVSRKADLDTATAHSALFRPIPTKTDQTNDNKDDQKPTSRAPNRVFGGSSEFDSERPEMRELGYENQNDVSYELRSFTYAPENPKYSPR